ncbi:MAG: hypothetical protein NC401_19045 [Ruminococcus sp.]|nr:hypothetical protein [Ruminococcus sp.]
MLNGLMLMSEGSQLTLPEVSTSSLGDMMSNIGTVVSGLLTSVVTPIMSFMLTTPLCVIGLGLSFCGAGFGFVKRALKTSRK